MSLRFSSCVCLCTGVPSVHKVENFVLVVQGYNVLFWLGELAPSLPS